MQPDHKAVLDALYRLEDRSIREHRFDVLSTSAEVASELPATHPRHGDSTWARAVLESLWVQRQVMQVAPPGSQPKLVDATLVEQDSGGQTFSIPVEQNDVRGPDPHPVERVALYASEVETRYRSRVSELARLLSRNHQRFRMLPSTGLLRYERRAQRRPRYLVDVQALRDQTIAAIRSGHLPLALDSGSSEMRPLDPAISRGSLEKAVNAALDALRSLLTERGFAATIAEFQAQSLLATLAGLYGHDKGRRREGHIVTAGVGSGKSYAFQLGALVHAAYRTLQNERGIGILLIYPRVMLAANQFQDLQILVQETGRRLGRSLAPPEFDAGGKLGEPEPGAAPKRGQKYYALQALYQGTTSILISNFDTLANRIAHPEASQGLTASLDLIVLDEVHLMSGLYGAHGRMLLKRLVLMRALYRLRQLDPAAPFSTLMAKAATVPKPYVIAASATIAEPCHHLARVLDTPPDRIGHIQVEAPEDSGWVHHFFLRQRPESSSQTAATNAISCLIHNRRDGLHNEYYQPADSAGLLGLDALDNPILPSKRVKNRDAKQIHKTLGFCDSLDGVHRWADLIADNEHTKSSAMTSSVNPVRSIPYFARFQEPLWRVVLHSGFPQRPPSWHLPVMQHYGALCRSCKQGVSCTVPRIPPGLRQAQVEALEKLWDLENSKNEESYLAQIGVRPDEATVADCFAAVRRVSKQETLSNLTECGFFQAGLCWWWSRDHLGNNRPSPLAGNTPLHGYRKPSRTQDNKYMPVNGVRVRAFTSQQALAVDSESINDIFRDAARKVFTDKNFGDALENCALVIGSPRLEVGVDLSRVRDGVTYRSMRDPSSLQQKVGRVGREVGSDSVLVHVVTDNARDHYYFRNPRIALDPEFLQPVPMHENNRIVARNHFFMALFDFLVLQGRNPAGQQPTQDSDRLMLINDHKDEQPFAGKWARKVQGAYDFLFGPQSEAQAHRADARAYLQALGAEPTDIERAGYQDQQARGAACSEPAGALDVFRHEFGPNFFLTRIDIKGGQMTLADLVSYKRGNPPKERIPGLPRHTEFLRTVPDQEATLNRSYVHNLLVLPLFRRGLPSEKLPGNQPFLWTPNLFDAIGRQYVRVFQEYDNNSQRELAHETISIVLRLLLPGTITYRFRMPPLKVPVSRFGATGLTDRQSFLKEVLLEVTDTAFFQRVDCPPLQPNELPGEFPDKADPIEIYQPRQIGLIGSASEPRPHQDGLLADGDEREFASSTIDSSLPTPPRCFALRWYRVECSTNPLLAIEDRLSTRYQGPGGAPIPAAPQPPILRLFDSIRYDGELAVTEFVWGLDRQFMSRKLNAARLIYRRADEAKPVALGQHFEAPALRFEIDLRSGSPIADFLERVLSATQGPVYQAMVCHALYDFLKEHGRDPRRPDEAPWIEQSRPSVFTVRNLRSIVLFHLLERWHPDASAAPKTPPRITLDDLVGCFTAGDPRYLDVARFRRVCSWLAPIQNPASLADRAETLQQCYANFTEACSAVAQLNLAHLRRSTEELLLNSLALAMHSAALRLSGAESENLSYFYRHRADVASEIFLFDSDDFGNGTVDLLRRNLHVSAIERVLVARTAALGGSPDPLPTNDYADCLEQELQECASSQASHLAFHDLPATAGCFRELDGLRHGERQAAGALFDFIRTQLSIGSYDDLLLLQQVPEFAEHVSRYALHGTRGLVSGTTFPTFQALESAFGCCIDGCVACVVEPEQNLHGVLTARETVSKLLLDALYRDVICSAADPITQATYPGTGPSRTVDWSQLATTVAANLGRTPSGLAHFTVALSSNGNLSDVTVFPALTPGAWSLVMRPNGDPAPVPTERVRPRMPL